MTAPKRIPDPPSPAPANVAAAPSAQDLLTAENSSLKETIERLNAEVARLTGSSAPIDYQYPKEAAFYSSVPRQTLMNWARAAKVKHTFDEYGKIMIDVIDARRIDALRRGWRPAPFDGPK
jgi:hypothetical protein